MPDAPASEPHLTAVTGSPDDRHDDDNDKLRRTLHRLQGITEINRTLTWIVRSTPPLTKNQEALSSIAAGALLELEDKLVKEALKEAGQ